MQELLQLPLQVQATLVAGYLGYILLKRDYRKTEKLSDMWLLILLLGLPTAITLQFCDSPWVYLIILTGPLLALGWLRFCEKSWSDFLYLNKFSNKLNDGDVWKTLSSHKNVSATQISLTRKDGSNYLCKSTARFENEPFAPYIMDEDGIAFYVTHVIGAEEDEWDEIDDVQVSDDNGSLITYFPREDIKLLEFRFETQAE